MMQSDWNHGNGLGDQSQVGGSGTSGTGTPGDTGNGLDPGAQAGGDGGGGGVPVLPSTPIGNGMMPPVTGGTSMADPSVWDAAGNFIGDSSVTGAGGSALANILKSIFGGAGGGDNSGLQALLKALAAAGGTLGVNALANKSAQNAVPPQLTQLMNTSVNRTQYQNPLFQAANQGVYAMLPNFAKTGNPGLDPSILNKTS